MRVVLLLLLFFIIGCAGTKRSSNNYFDTKTYFKDEASRLSSSVNSAAKTLVFNGDTQAVALIDPVDWEKELAPFSDVDLSNDAFSGLFDVDTAVDNSASTITYLCIDPRIELRKAVIVSENDRITRISYEMQTQNSLYSNRTLLDYKPGQGYNITGFQKVNLLNESTYFIKASWN